MRNLNVMTTMTNAGTGYARKLTTIIVNDDPNTLYGHYFSLINIYGT